MTLIECGLAPGRFEVVGADVSQRALGLAAEGRFGPAAFRERDEAATTLQQRYFRPVDGDQFQLTSEVTEVVRFRRDNLITASFLYDEQPFDVVFCRNLLIYLAPAPTRRPARRAADEPCPPGRH